MEIEEIPQHYSRLKKEMAKVIVGQESTIEKMVIALLCKAHVLLIGPPGLAKTSMVNAFSQALHLNFNRIQFTPDLMPSDILGTEILQENKSTGKRELNFIHGPIFTNILLADEINRTPPKTQAALLQAMQEKIVTIFGRTEKLQEPFMVLATQNPIEQEGTYPLPEAQLDRFIFSIQIDYPSYEEELAIVKKTTQTTNEFIIPMLERENILALQEKVLAMTVPEHIYEFAVKVVRATRPEKDNEIKEIKNYVKWGAGPRAVQFLILAAKAKALLAGRPIPTEKDILSILKPTLNHRILLNFQAEAENIDVEKIIALVLKSINA